MKGWLNLILIISASLTIGICGTLLYQDFNQQVIEDCSTQAKIGGLWIRNMSSLQDYAGTFICVNIEQTKTLRQLEKTCEHEVGHEIFARECAKDFEKCLGVSDE